MARQPDATSTWHIDRIRSNIASLQKEALSQGRKFGFAHHDGDAGGFYEGEFRFFLKHGQGFLEIEKGTDTYQGQFVNDRFEGHGSRKWADGSTYSGQWVAGQKHGVGVLKTASGLEYRGEWRQGLRHGTGEQTYPTGVRYCGQFIDGQLHGKGSYTHVDGRVFDGHWKMNKRHGEGLMYNPAAQSSCVMENYDDGTLTKGTRLDRKPSKVYNWRAVNQRATLSAWRKEEEEGAIVMTTENTVGIPTFAQRDENRRLKARRSQDGSPGRTSVSGDGRDPLSRPDSPSPDSPRPDEIQRTSDRDPLAELLERKRQSKEWSPTRSSKEWTATEVYLRSGVTAVDDEAVKLGLG